MMHDGLMWHANIYMSQSWNVNTRAKPKCWHFNWGTYTLCIRKVSTFKLFVTLSNLNWFSNFLHCWMKCATKSIQLYPPHLRHVATLPWEIKNSIYCRYSGDMEENANKLHFKKLPTSEIRVSTSLLCTPSNTNFLSKSCPGRWMSCWLLKTLQRRLLWRIFVWYGFCSALHTLYSSARILTIGYDLTKLRRV